MDLMLLKEVSHPNIYWKVRTEKIIAENRGFLDAMVQELLKEKTLTKKQIKSIRDSVVIRA